MRLKRLSLQGYKTFASKTSFEFNESITAVVGPNGSGKSNIADAIRWVLGEQSYSTLRGKRTEDMIFAGSRERSRAGMAQAILTLDNSEGWLPIDYSEIEIGRRAFRSGENEYLLNGQKVRLKDVTELLANSGLAQRTYTIIGQGLVDQALSLKADQRRMLFEEAAGVSGYKLKRGETLRRLDETTRNLERIHDIVSEIHPRLRSLRRQANRARNYEQVATDLRYHLRIWHGYNWDRARQNLHRNSQACELAQKEWEEERRLVIKNQEQLQELRRQINQHQIRLRRLEADRDELRENVERSRRLVAVLNERKSAARQQLRELDEDIPNLQQQQESARLELDQAIEDLRIAETDLEEQQTIWQRSLLSTNAAQQEIDKSQKDVRELALSYERSQKELALAQGSLNQLRRQLEEKELIVGDDVAAAAFDAEKKSNQAELEDIAGTLENLHEEREKNQHVKERQDQKLERIREEIIQLEDSGRSLRDEIAAERARLEILEKLQRQEVDLPETASSYTQVLDLVTVPNQYATAIEAALNYRLSTILLPDEASLWDLTGQDQAGQISALVENRMSTLSREDLPNHPGIIGWCDTLVEAKKEMQESIRVLFGRILLVRDDETAYSIASTLPLGSIAVSPRGFIAHPDGLVEFGVEDLQFGILDREENRRQIEGNLSITQSRLEEISESLGSARRMEEETQDAIDQCEQTESGLRLEIISNEREITKIQQTLALIKQKQTLNLDQRQADIAEAEKLAEQISKVEQRIIKHTKEAEELRIALQESQKQLESLPIHETQQQREQLQHRLEASKTIIAGRQAVIDSRRATLSQADNLLQRVLERRKELQAVLQQIDLNQSQDNLSRLEAAMDSLNSDLRPQIEKLEKTRRELETVEAKLGEKQRRSHELESRYTHARIELGQSENAIDTLKDRISADLGIVALSIADEYPEQSPLPIADMVEELPQVEHLPEDVEETIQRLRGQLNRMGGFNPDAPVEYEETKERHDFLLNQIEDLENTRQRLRQVIEELDEETSRAFASTVEQVDTVFGDVFQRLFGGGSAQLILTDPDDLISSGVDIVARLPRRREQGLALLSGGERSLTAAALIFALLKVSPTPFCVLDEVDAMLDEANINRFRDMLLELSENTQFILITHNRGTVQVAESVYGVSMGADSVSQVISIRPEEYVSSPSLN